jgi:hypothetical protein
MTTFTHKFLGRSGLVTLLLLTLTFLLQAGCHRSTEENVSNVNSKGNLGNANIQEPPPKSAKSIAADPLADNLVLIIKDWSGLEVAGLDRRSPLSNIWTLNHAPSAPYDPQGINSLIGKIRSSSYFKSTPQLRDRLRKLKRSLFVANGRIQNRGQLYDFLGS